MRKSILILWLAAVCLACLAGCGDDENLVPYFTRVEADPACGVAPLNVEFLAMASGGDLKDEPTGSNASVDIAWDYMDGGTGFGSINYHVFEQPGVYDVEVVATDDDGDNSEIRVVQIVVREDRLTAVAIADRDVVAPGDTVRFDAIADLCDFDPVAGNYTRFDFLWYLDDEEEPAFRIRRPLLVAEPEDVGVHQVRLSMTDLQTSTTRWDTLTVEVAAGK